VNEFLGEIGRKLAERWIALLAVPGLLYIAAVTVAATLGQKDALNYVTLSQHITGWASSAALKSIGGTVLIVVAVLVGSVLAGLAATAFGRLVEIVWVMPGKRRPAKWLADWRRKRSRDAKHIADDPSASQAQGGLKRSKQFRPVESRFPEAVAPRTLRLAS
jgi:NAD/NADP transhydrogenase beta subunit